MKMLAVLAVVLLSLSVGMSAQTPQADGASARPTKTFAELVAIGQQAGQSRESVTIVPLDASRTWVMLFDEGGRMWTFLTPSVSITPEATGMTMILRGGVMGSPDRPREEQPFGTAIFSMQGPQARRIAVTMPERRAVVTSG